MGMTIEMVGAEKLIAKFDTYEIRLRQCLQTAMEKIVNNIVNFIKSDELSGQVLHRRTGTLSRSIKGIVTNDPDRIIGNVTSRDGGNAPLAYAAIHEYGGVIHIPARTVTMHRFMDRNGDVGGLVKKSKSNFATDHQARGYDIHMPARPYFRPARAAKEQYMQEALKNAVVKVNKS